MEADSRLSSWLLKLADKYAHRLSVDDRLQLASLLLKPSPPAAPAECERPEAPRWSRQRRRLWALMEFARAAREVLIAEDASVTCADLAKQCQAWKDDIEKAMTLLNDVEDYGGLGVPHGADLLNVRHALACQHAEEVDADLGRRNTVTDPNQPPWTISYDYRNGKVTATCAKADSDGHTADLLSGFAPTPAAAADLVVGWHTTAPPVTFDDPPPERSLLRVAYRESTPLSVPTLFPVTLLERGGSCYEEFLAACGRIRAELRAAGDIKDWLFRRADHLNRTAPHVPDRNLASVLRPAHGHGLGFLDGMVQWVRPELVISTYSDAWGEFGGHREYSLIDIAAGLAATDDLPAFAHELFDDGPIDLIRVPAWAGPVYDLNSNGGHRVHAARLLGLPWLAAQVGYRQHATEWDLATLTIENGYIRGREYRAHRLQLIEGLHRRGIIDAEVLPGTDKRFRPRVRCTRLPAPWLLRDPEFTTTVNAAYECCYPGALEQLGIRVEIGTRPDKWAAWLTSGK